MNLQRYFRWLCVVVYCGLLFYSSHQPRVPIPPISQIDKVFHFLAYGLLGLLLFNALTGQPKRRFHLAWCLACLYGLSDEFHQSFVPGRDVSVLDWLADTLGAIAFCGAAYAASIKIKYFQ